MICFVIDYYKNIRYTFKMEESTITRTIKFTDKKCIMKPMDNQIGKTELWSATPPVTNLRNIYFKFQGINYYLIASSED